MPPRLTKNNPTDHPAPRLSYKRRRRTAARGKGFVSALCVAACALTPLTPCSAGPKNVVSGLKDIAWVDHKDNQTLKILAQNDHDLFFLWGYYHAADRFFQMDVSRRQIQGELAALLGEAALPEDFRNRMLGVKQASERSWDELDASAKTALTAYSAGVNAYLAQGTLPAEYQTLNLSQAKSWTPIDSIAVMKGLVIHLSLRLDTGRTETLQHYVQTGQDAGFDGTALFFEDTHPIRPITAHTTYATAGLAAPYGRLFERKTLPQSAQLPTAPNRTLLHALTELRQDLNQSHLWRGLAAAESETTVGSNWWAVSGKYSQSGYPLIAGDPHLSTPWPGVFYEVHLRVTKDPDRGHLHAAGASIPGVPAIAHGQNEDLLWVSTNNGLDASDVFLDTLITTPAPSRAAAPPNPPEPQTDDEPAPHGNPDQIPPCRAASGLCILSEEHAHPVVYLPQTYHVNTSNPNNPDRVIPIDPPAEFAQLAQVPFRTYGPILKVTQPPEDNQPGQAFVLQYTGLAATREIMSFLHWLRATSITDFQQGLSHFEVGSQNWLVTDVDGDLAYLSSAKAPLRKDLEAGMPQGYGPAFVRDGSGSANWVKPDDAPPGSPAYDALPADEMPRIINPPSGILINANNDPTGQTLDGNLLNQTREGQGVAIYYLNHGYADGLRAQQITDRLTALLGTTSDPRDTTTNASAPPKRRKRVSLNQLQALQTDAFQQDAIYLYPRLKAAAAQHCQAPSTSATEDPFAELCQDPFVIQALSTLATWDYSTPTGIDWDTAKNIADPEAQAHSQAALYYHLWRAHLIHNLIYHPLHEHALPEPSARLALRALIHRLNQPQFTCQGASGLDFCGQTPTALADERRRDLALLTALVDVSETLASDEFQTHLTTSGLTDWAWGAVHRQRFRHPLSDQTPAPYGVPASNLLSRFTAWGGFPRAGGYEVVDAAPVPADALSLDALITEHGAARRIVGGMKKGFFSRGMRSTAVLPTGRQAQNTPESVINDWIHNKHRPAFDSESFMRMRWEKHLPKR